jgi:hypothetical protein
MNDSHTISGIEQDQQRTLPIASAHQDENAAEEGQRPTTNSPNTAIGRGTRPDLYIR